MTASLAAADDINVDAVAAAALSELDKIFTLKAEQKTIVNKQFFLVIKEIFLLNSQLAVASFVQASGCC